VERTESRALGSGNDGHLRYYTKPRKGRIALEVATEHLHNDGKAMAP
jgi:hypothetical protein